MEPNKFRESRQTINRMYDQMDQLIEQKAFEELTSKFETVRDNLEALKPEAEGEIQERSVKNLDIRLNRLAIQIGKLSSQKKSSKASGGRRSEPEIIWDEDRLAELAPAYLEKVIANMEGDDGAVVMLGTTGKGIRPNYRIRYRDGRVCAFSGSGHKPLKTRSKNSGSSLSDPFGHSLIQRILASEKEADSGSVQGGGLHP